MSGAQRIHDPQLLTERANHHSIGRTFHSKIIILTLVCPVSDFSRFEQFEVIYRFFPLRLSASRGRRHRTGESDHVVLRSGQYKEDIAVPARPQTSHTMTVPIIQCNSKFYNLIELK